jgi:arylsulfatase A-like enzyme
MRPLMKKVAALTALAGAAVGLSCSLLQPRTKPEPCFVLIVVDSMRADHLGAYGYARATSPRIDALAGAGLTFTNAYSQAPWTKPSVASIFTSTYISVHRVLYSKVMVKGKEHSDVLNEKFVTLAEALSSKGYATAGFGKKIHLLPPYGFSQGFGVYDMDAGDAPEMNEKVVRWLRKDDPDRFFLYLHYNDVHYPYTPRGKKAVFGRGEPRVQIDGPTKAAFRKGELKLSKSDIDQLVDLYDDEILDTDRYIGDLVEAIAKRGYTNVLVAITADHGEEFLDHGDITHGQSLYNELVRVPLVLAGSGLPERMRGRKIEYGVQLIDLMPTILDLSGTPQPPMLQGRSLASAVTGQEIEEPRTSIFSQRRDVEETEFSRTVQEGKWKLVVDATGGRTLLFDVTADPEERTSLAAENPLEVDRLAAELVPWSAANDALYARIRPEHTTPLDPETEKQLRSLGYVQ